ncbi:MAG: hypothetical protein AAGA57_09460 [Planctomycetota bacterium]
MPFSRKTSLSVGLSACLAVMAMGLGGCEMLTGGGSEEASSEDRQRVVGSVTEVYNTAGQVFAQLGIERAGGQNAGVYAALVGKADNGSGVQVYVYAAEGGKSDFVVTTSDPVDLELQAKVAAAILLQRGE